MGVWPVCWGCTGIRVRSIGCGCVLRWSLWVLKSLYVERVYEGMV